LGTVAVLGTLLLGSYLGIGAPAGLPRLPSLPAATASIVPPQVPADAPAPTIDPSLLPDPEPFPRLNRTASRTVGWLQAEGPAELAGDGHRYVTLTFDDGPSPDATPSVLEMLAAHQIRAAFFFIGRNLDGPSKRATATRQVAKDVLAAGHFVGSHTKDHLPLTTLDRVHQAAEIDEGIASVERATGAKPFLFRPPYGALDGTAEVLVHERNLELVMWSVEVGDMKNSDEDAMFYGLVEQLDFAGGGTVLLHDIHRSSVHVLARLLAWLDAHRWDPARPERVGYEVVDLPAFARLTAARPQPYADRKTLEDARAAAWRKGHPHRNAPPPAMIVDGVL